MFFKNEYWEDYKAIDTAMQRAQTWEDILLDDSCPSAYKKRLSITCEIQRFNILL
jgi:hypothetical protein